VRRERLKEAGFTGVRILESLARHIHDKGFILRTSVAPLDAAVIEIAKGGIPTLAFSEDRPKPGTLIAIAGYPSIQLQTDFQPSVNEGIVNDIVDGFYIEHDAALQSPNRRDLGRARRRMTRSYRARSGPGSRFGRRRDR
jgi:hypothetical protein